MGVCCITTLEMKVVLTINRSGTCQKQKWYLLETKVVSARSRSGTHQNQKRYSPEPEVVLTRTRSGTHQNQKRYSPEPIGAEPSKRSECNARNGRDAKRTNEQSPVVTTKSYLTVQHHH